MRSELLMLLRTRASAPTILLSAEYAPRYGFNSYLRIPAKSSTETPAEISYMLAFVENNAHHARSLTHKLNVRGGRLELMRDLAPRSRISKWLET
jgi:hypothetical protein